MGKSHPLSQMERERIYQKKTKGNTVKEIAAELGRSEEVVKKWWGRIREEGVAGLADRKPGKKPKGILSSFDKRVGEEALRLKRLHSKWGAPRVLIELPQTPEWPALDLPSPSRLAVFFKKHCPECIATYHPRPPARARPVIATAVHEVWQLDSQEKFLLHDGTIATVCNVRDPFGAVMIGSRAFSVKTEKHWRKLNWTEIRELLRSSFAEWKTLPERVLTDNELCLAGAPTDPFPSRLTLWLCGFGIAHKFIRPHRPTDQAEIERNHRTLDNLTMDEESRANLETLQRALDKERRVHNQLLPSRASNCNGLAPLTAHPELLQPHRSYSPEYELLLFDLQRIYDYLSTFVFDRKVNSTGSVSLGRILYSIGHCQAGKALQVRCDPITHEWVFFQRAEEKEVELEPRTIKKTDIVSLTGLEPQAVQLPQPIQLTLPTPM